MKKKVAFLAGILTLPLFAFGAIALDSQPALAQGTSEGARGGVNASNTGNVPENIDGNDGLVTTVVNILLWAIGLISVIMIIIGGIRYATSNGDSNAVTAAKNTIMYAVIGLVIAIFAYAIVNFVLVQITG